MVTYSYGQLDSVINSATTNNTGQVQWLGANGEKVILQQLNQRIRDFGVINVQAAQLPFLSGVDAATAIVEGVGVYRYSPSVAASPNPNDIIAGTGTWVFLGPLKIQSFRQTVGNGGTLTFQINHNLNCTTPHVSAYDISAGLPYTKMPGANITVSVIDANSLNITFTSAPAGLGAIVAVSI